MSGAARKEAGPVRGCGALRGGGRRQKRASHGLLVGAARSWRWDWLRHSRVRRLLGSGRAPRPRARRPLSARPWDGAGVQRVRTQLWDHITCLLSW
ncbi:hypothetical protein VULLAG_LOCUS2861 [Vulpes lagopus]